MIPAPWYLTRALSSLPEPSHGEAQELESLGGGNDVWSCDTKEIKERKQRKKERRGGLLKRHGTLWKDPAGLSGVDKGRVKGPGRMMY